jgi:hypothetical protein
MKDELTFSPFGLRPSSLPILCFFFLCFFFVIFVLLCDLCVISPGSFSRRPRSTSAPRCGTNAGLK